MMFSLRELKLTMFGVSLFLVAMAGAHSAPFQTGPPGNNDKKYEEPVQAPTINDHITAAQEVGLVETAFVAANRNRTLENSATTGSASDPTSDQVAGCSNGSGKNTGGKTTRKDRPRLA